MNSNTRIIGAILVLLLISIIAFEVSGLGLSSYLANRDQTTLHKLSDMNYFSLVLESTAIIVIAITLAIILFTLFSSTSLEANKRRKLNEITADVQKKHHTVSDSIQQIHEHTEKAEQLISKLQQKFDVLDKLQNSAETRGNDLDETAEKLYAYERDLRRSAENISSRLDQVQNYWDDQLEETVETVKRIKHSLSGGLTQVEEGVGRIREQENMAQNFTKKLVKTYEEQAEIQRENNRITNAVRENLEATLDESNQLLERLQSLHKNADETFQTFSTRIDQYEGRAYEQFESLFNNIETARKEADANLQASNTILAELKTRKTDTQHLHQKIDQQLDQLEVDRVRILTETLDDTSKMCHALKQDVDDARHVLQGLSPLTHRGTIEEAIDYEQPILNGSANGASHEMDNNSKGNALLNGKHHAQDVEPADKKKEDVLSTATPSNSDMTPEITQENHQEDKRIDDLIAEKEPSSSDDEQTSNNANNKLVSFFARPLNASRAYNKYN